MDAFAKTPSFLKNIDKAKVRIEKTCGAKVFTSSTLWGGQGEGSLEDILNDPNGEEQLITLKVLDLPGVHHYLKESKDNYIYKQLSDLKDDDIFSSISIKALIE